MSNEKEFTAADYIALIDPPPKKVVIKDVGVFYVRVMSIDERDDYELSVYDKSKLTFGKVRAGLLVKTVCDSAGKRLFEDAGTETFGRIMSPALVEKLFAAARKINWFSEKDIQELEKNSESDLQDASS